jgi:hypothetical protein
MSFIPLYTFNNYIDANLRLMHMQEEGINCWLKDEHTVTIDPIISNAIGGIKLMVHESQKERAADLLRTMMNKEKLQTPCINCKSHNVEYIITNRKPANWFSAIATFLLGDFAMAPHKVYHCFDCGTEFQKSDEKEAEKKITE